MSSSKPSLRIDVASSSTLNGNDVYESKTHTTTLTTLSSTLKTHPSPYHMDDKFDQPQPIHHQPQPPSEPYVPPQPSLRLLLSLTVRRDAVILVPAILAAACAAAMPPLMTVVVGQAFDTFAHFPPTLNPSQDARSELLRGIGLVAVYLAAIAVGTFFFSGALSALWIWFGERTVMRLRRLVYAAVASREMEWFDLGSGADRGEGEESVGAGGLMAKFARDTDDVRLATSLNLGMLIQLILTFIVTLVLAFKRSPTLTVVILSSIPIMVIVQFFTQFFAFRFLTAERNSTANASTTIDRAIASIATVKAFNAQAFEEARTNYAINEMKRATRSCSAVWGISSGVSGFVMFGMFVQGFWYGSKLVREGQISPGDVLAVFWSCLIASSSLQMTIPLLVIYTRGKSAMASLVTLVHPPPNPPRRSNSTHRTLVNDTPKSPFSFTHRSSHRKPVPLQKIKPASCKGAFDLRLVTFSYPSRPNMPVLEDISIYLPDSDTTFIVGGSGSGKSTLAQLLLRLYEPNTGEILLDEQDFFHLDTEWTRSHIAAVSQGCILFDMSVHDNVAMGLAGSDSGRKPSDATREEVIAACRSALMHDFVRDLPDAYDTMLGNGGANLSGGQKQRLAIARVFIRNPTVLILDEATSALDVTSRLLVFEAIRKWRKSRTTIVITHDLSQIGPDDFVYVLSQGRVVEQGFRRDLEDPREGEFYRMMSAQGATGGYLPVKDVTTEENGKAEERDAIVEQAEQDGLQAANTLRHRSALGGYALAPRTTLFGAVGSLTRGPLLPHPGLRPGAAPVRFFPEDVLAIPGSPITLMSRRSSLTISIPRSPAHEYAWKRSSLQFSPISPTFLKRKPSDMTIAMTVGSNSPRDSAAFDHVVFQEPRVASNSVTDVKEETTVIEDDYDFEKDKTAMRMTAMEASSKRRMNSTRRKWEEEHPPEMFRTRFKSKRLSRPRRKPVPPVHPVLESVVVVKKGDGDEQPRMPFTQLFKIFWPTVPTKSRVIFFCGLVASLLHGAVTPVFAFLLSQLVVAVTTGEQSESFVNNSAVVVLFLALANGLTCGLKYYLLELAALNWIRQVRKSAFRLVMRQDKAWFDQSKNSAPALVQVLMKDSESTRQLMSNAAGQIVVVATMLGIGLIWAMVLGWQLSLIGLVIGPVFGTATAIQGRLVAKFEYRNKRCREEVNKKYYDAVANIRAIRGMHLEGAFKEDFERSLDKAVKSGINGAFVDGLGYGVANGLIYLFEGLLFYVGAVFIANGTYTYLQMIQVLNLVVFSVCIAGQMLSFVQRIGKYVQGARDLERLVSLKTETVEAQGKSRYHLQGEIAFHHVSFAYPSRPEVPILKDFDVKIKYGECVAIVGASGCGKSTIAGLLQRLYEPTGGLITLNGHRLSDTDALWLRNRIAVVSQQPHLFDASVEQNIAYGTDIVDHARIVRAAKEANVHDFIMTLPQGYSTHLGENASLISGGQAQRIQIARALVRSAGILILDECTSALDIENQKTIMSTIKRVKVGRTTVFITHKLPVMQMADRILVIDDGGVAEDGTYDDLMTRKGVFWKLATVGEWEGE